MLKWQETNQSQLLSLFIAVLICFELEHWPGPFNGASFFFFGFKRRPHTSTQELD